MSKKIEKGEKITVKNADVIAVLGLKGGVGKTTISWHVLPSILKQNQRDFVIFEIDDNNESNAFNNSDIISSSNSKTVKTDDKAVAAEIVIETMTSDNCVIIDAGGGNDTKKVLEIVKSLGSDVKVLYIIPIDRNVADFKTTALPTAALIESDNILFVQNQFFSKEEFEFFPVETFEFARVNFSPLFQYAQNLKYTIYDLSQICQTLTKEEAKNLFKEKFTKDGILDKASFIEAFNDYQKSEEAAKLISQFSASFQPFWQK